MRRVAVPMVFLTVSCTCAASVSQMLTGSVIIFAAILSRIILKRKLNRWHYAGYDPTAPNMSVLCPLTRVTSWPCKCSLGPIL